MTAKMVALDTSVVVAALLEWHEAHSACLQAVDRALGSAAGVALPVPALVEAYSVMTRLPAPHRLSPSDALAVLSGTFHGAARLVSIKGDVLWAALDLWSNSDVAGGRAYDAHILACAKSVSASCLLTLNGRDFKALADDAIEIVVPGE